MAAMLSIVFSRNSPTVPAPGISIFFYAEGKAKKEEEGRRKIFFNARTTGRCTYIHKYMHVYASYISFLRRNSREIIKENIKGSDIADAESDKFVLTVETRKQGKL